jgi:mannose/fructose/N-acetylgalactosamine-specific phosphotransferase system component IID
MHKPNLDMYLIAIAWIYVVLMMAVAEALSSQGTVLGAVFTFCCTACCRWAS